MRVLLLLVIMVLCAGCVVCSQGAQRCFDNQAQLCDTAGTWRTVMHCSKLKSRTGDTRPWSCGPLGDEKVTCAPTGGAK